jgi:hypothetical protein
MVPLVVAGRPYVILPADVAGRTAMRIGMDDPQLAEQLETTAFDAGPEDAPTAIPYRIGTDEPFHDRLSSKRAGRFSGANGSAPAIFDRRRSWLISSKRRELRRTADIERDEADAGEARSRSRVAEIGVAAVLTMVGSLTAYFSASEQGLNPLTWTLAGGGLGLFMAWICLKWTR